MKGMTVGAHDRKIQMIIRETSGMKKAELELVARPFTEIISGDIADVTTIAIGLSDPQVTLPPGGLQRVEVTIGGFAQAGSYLGGITIHDTVSGEQKEVSIRVSVKDAWPFPILVLLVSVLVASGVNHWTKKGRRKNRLDQHVAELHKTINLAGTENHPFLLEAEQLLETAREQNQNYHFAQAEAAIEGVQQKLAQYEQRKQESEELRQRIQTVLQDVRDLGDHDPQAARLAGELIHLLPNIDTDYEETAAVFKQLEAFFAAYRLARKDLQTAREKLFSNREYVRKADKSKIEFMLDEIDRLLATAKNMSALDEVNTLLRKVAFELSPEKINENMFRSQRLQKRLETYTERVKEVTGSQVSRVVTTWHDTADTALADNRYDDADDALAKLDTALEIIEQIKQAERRIKGRDPKMTELRRIIREGKSYLEGTSWEALHRAEHDVRQVLEILDGQREEYEPFQAEAQEASPDMPEGAEEAPPSDDIPTAEAERPADIRPLSSEDLQHNLDRLMHEASRYPKLRENMLKWREYCAKLLEFDELIEMSEYLRLIQDELELYDRIQAIRTQAEAKNLPAVLRLTQQAEQMLLHDDQDERDAFHRAEVLTDAAKSLLDERHHDGELDQVLSYLRSPNTASHLITYGTLSSYFVIATVLGFQILYVPNPDFGAILFEDYLSLVLWAFGLEGAKLTATNVYEAYFKKAG
ncbi:hypothetical protein GF339_09760 [candidate division KSB3 bacterium]|uniref:Uncharacterized protein n=1 Tax=candidate division KSB3 bacterium TaxID=2044937 RepID=A0A9D5JVF2_9BACT|nr:hypothetical protein [candidate division KSB3 bacterium]